MLSNMIFSVITDFYLNCFRMLTVQIVIKKEILCLGYYHMEITRGNSYFKIQRDTVRSNNINRTYIINTIMTPTGIDAKLFLNKFIR